LLTVRFTAAPPASDFPAVGLCEITEPFFTCLELAFLILPTEQWALFSVAEGGGPRIENRAMR
jgi:hypothetical protein